MHLTTCMRILLAAAALITTAAATPVAALRAREASESGGKKQCRISPKVFIISMVRLALIKTNDSFN